LKIKDVKVYLVNAVWRNFVITKIDTDEGISGYGEGTMGDFEKTVEAAIYDFKPFLIGREINIQEIYNFLYRHFFWRGGPILMTAISAIEQALWDILGKSVNKPVYELLGGKVRDSVRVYANGFISGDRSPEEFANAVRGVVEMGFNAVKIDPFGGSGPKINNEDLEKAKDRLRAIRDSVGYSIDIMIDAHGRFNPTSAIKSVEVVSSLSYLYLYNEYYLWVGSLYLGKTFLVPLVVVIMLLSVVGLWVGRSFCVGIVVSTSWVMLVIIIILGS
jgi:L-alanine-DL-glutamate epimerase and related enzymes of enolase superfamily